jgi:SanA protein
MFVRKAIWSLAIIIILSILIIFLINLYIINYSKRYIIIQEKAPQAQAAIILGAYVTSDGTLCDMLKDRVLTGVELYKAGKVKKLLMSGDHGTVSYDEVNNMRKYAQELGVPKEDIFMDHAGFSTYESMYRARDVFGVNSVIIVTQNFIFQERYSWQED